ncbi:MULTISPECIES: YopJ/AvrA family T3SS effector serine/threonine acetyltransferase [unclassified Bartonella]|uniref:YopJ/AvrA family T3SS effector serine/threonine acetyltransferase n=1 Tax=unclassified Bartonella TaxID=2645622 RepID=UPI0009995F0E|nr:MULTISPECIES: YopJ/AvrA family T3SS effector serine/threonine acetyltransferase [unclassified Bartonella]AQX17970.1 YopJ protease family [Bartonella sp. A1379B]AQX22482.1 YopJ protease family [Bartonella sp. 11B]AQX24236.1 YopJ protease family [Bartonella sp. 114]
MPKSKDLTDQANGQDQASSQDQASDLNQAFFASGPIQTSSPLNSSTTLEDLITHLEILETTIQANDQDQASVLNQELFASGPIQTSSPLNSGTTLESLITRLEALEATNQASGQDQASGLNQELFASGPIQTSSPLNSSTTLEELITHLETSKANEATEKPSILFNKKALKSVISDLENDITNSSFVDANYAHMDLTMMPRLVKQENDKCPEINLQFITSPEKLVKSIQKVANQGIPSSRFLMCLEGNDPHFAIIDQQTIANRTSLILFETTKFAHMNAEILGVTVKSAIEAAQLPYCYFSMAEMNLQADSSESGIISLLFAKKLHLEADKLKVMHQDNISGILCKRGVPLPYHKVDEYLPGTFYKHAQTGKRIAKYVNTNREYFIKKINNKDEILHHRLDRHSVLLEDKVVSCSSQKKRIQKYKALVR